jgi:hypothetical protein
MIPECVVLFARKAAGLHVESQGGQQFTPETEAGIARALKNESTDQAGATKAIMHNRCAFMARMPQVQAALPAIWNCSELS